MADYALKTHFSAEQLEASDKKDVYLADKNELSNKN